MNWKSIVRSFLMFFYIVCIIGCCGAASAAQSGDGTSKIITDMRGAEVSVPQAPQRIVVMDDGTVESMMVIFGVADRIVGLPRTPKNYTYNFTSMKTNETYWYRGGRGVSLVLFPDLVKATVVGRNAPNYETLASLSPDLVIGSSLNYVGESRQRIWPLFLCVSVVGSEHSGSPQRRKDTENFRFKFTHSKQRGALLSSTRDHAASQIGKKTRNRKRPSR